MLPIAIEPSSVAPSCAFAPFRSAMPAAFLGSSAMAGQTLTKRSHAALASHSSAVAGIAVELRGASVDGIPHTPWRLLEHMRICQWDILEFSRDADHVSPEFPDGYWPDTAGPPDEFAWDNSLAGFNRDLKEMIDLVSDPATDLLARIPHGNGQTVLREALLVADHNAYHIRQLGCLRRALGDWQD